MVFVFKLFVASGLIYWLVSSGRIDFSILLKSSENKYEWLVAFLILSVNMVVISFRWKKILDIQSSIKLKLHSMVKFTFIGNLFNTVLPGLVSGDFIKLLYVKKIDPKLTKTFLVASVFIDRIIGLFGLLILLGITSIIFHKELLSLSPDMKYLLNMNYILFSGMVFFLFTLFLPRKLQFIIVSLLRKIPFIGRFFVKVFMQFWLIGKNKLNILNLMLISVFTQILNIVIFWTLAKPYIEYAVTSTPPLSLLKLYTFIPLGFVATAIPITPAGIGVGHTAFDVLFRYYGVINGASLFNFHFVLNVFMNLLGLFPYLAGNKERGMVRREAENF